MFVVNPATRAHAFIYFRFFTNFSKNDQLDGLNGRLGEVLSFAFTKV